MRDLGDLNYALAPLVSFLNTLGGWSFRTIVRRIGIPVVIVLFAGIYYRLKKWFFIAVYLATFALVFGALTLPLTFSGDRLSASWFNYAWIFLLGATHAASLVPLTCLYHPEDEAFKTAFKRKILLLAFGIPILMICYGVPVLISNVTNLLGHKTVEVIHGLAFGFLAARLIEKK